MQDKGEKKAGTPTRSDSLKTTPTEGGMSSSTVPSVCVEDATHKVQSPSVADQGQSGLETSLSVSKPVKHVLIAHSNLSDPGYASQASMSTLGEGGSGHLCPRTYSSVSNTSADSYHTALSGASPNSSGHVPPRFAVPGQDDMMKEILEKLNQIENKSW